MIDLAVDALAAARLTRLVTADTVTEPVRSWIIRSTYLVMRGEDDVADLERDFPHSTWTERAADDPAAPALATLLTCSWCAGVWVAAAVTVARRRSPRWAGVAEAAAVAYVAGRLARTEP